MLPERMSRAELRAGASLAGVFGLRMLGLFLILPVFAVHAPQLAGGDNLTLVGIALGAYGLSQAILQIPFGMASDRWGRKPVIYAGLVIFAAGSFVAAGAHDIWTAIAGRTLQGAGAISSVVVPLAADPTRELPSHWKLYLPVVLVSFAFMVPPILYADRRNRPKPVLVGAIVLLAAVQLSLPLAASLPTYALAILAFFVAFNVLEALLPSLVS